MLQMVAPSSTRIDYALISNDDKYRIGVERPGVEKRVVCCSLQEAWDSIIIVVVTPLAAQIAADCGTSISAPVSNG